MPAAGRRCRAGRAAGSQPGGGAVSAGPAGGTGLLQRGRHPRTLPGLPRAIFILHRENSPKEADPGRDLGDGSLI